MPKNVMKLLKRSANHSRNAFDLSHRHLFSANFGELLPVTCIETVPGDYIELRVSDLLRALPMITSPFMRVKQHFDVWFTPYEDMWSNFESFMVQKYEPKHGNNLGAFDFCPHTQVNRLFSIATSRSAEDVVGRDFGAGALKLLDLLGYGRADASGGTDDARRVNLWRLAQYNKIWYEEYRQQYYDDGMRLLDVDADMWNYKKNPAVLFNFDDMPCDTVARADVGKEESMAFYGNYAETRLAAMMQMRYRCWKKDLFTGLMPSTQFGNVSTVKVTSEDFITRFNLNVVRDDGTVTDLAGRYLMTQQSSGSDNSLPVTAGSKNTTITDNGIDFYLRDSNGRVRPIFTPQYDSAGNMIAPRVNILDLRKSEAIQIWREAALTAGNRVGDNLRAHYGDDVDYNDHRSSFLGSVDAPLNISDVNATAETGSATNGVLGDVAGKGISSLDEKVFKFKAKKFGCIMVMFSLLPEAEYNSDGIDRMNQLLESEDYFVNEYQDLGLEAVSSLNFYSAPVSRVIGYAPRYYGYKQKMDKVFGKFRTGGIYAPWASPKADVTQVLADNPEALPLNLLYVNPNLFNQNFSVDTSNSDQMLCDVYFDCSAVRQMSISGLPKF